MLASEFGDDGEAAVDSVQHSFPHKPKTLEELTNKSHTDQFLPFSNRKDPMRRPKTEKWTDLNKSWDVPRLDEVVVNIQGSMESAKTLMEEEEWDYAQWSLSAVPAPANG